MYFHSGPSDLLRYRVFLEDQGRVQDLSRLLAGSNEADFNLQGSNEGVGDEKAKFSYSPRFS